jgi:methionyl-tRNA formyltransferase
MSKKPKILLLCHNRMAVPTLRYLWEEGLLAAVAVPDLYDFVQQPFLELAHQLQIPFISLNKNTYRQELEKLMGSIQPDAVFVISFPWLIPVSALPLCPYGFLNFHGGLLPEMRGSDPMFHCIRYGIRTTGITVHQMDDGMDTGPVILQSNIEIGPETTHGMLSAQIAFACEQASREIVTQVRTGEPLATTMQDEDKAVYLPKPAPGDTAINWETMTSTEIKALVNACNPQLKGATATCNNWNFGITHVTEINLTGDTGAIKPGTIIYANPQEGMIIYCSDGKGLRLDITYTEEGYLPGYRLTMFGLAPGIQLERPATGPVREMA